MSPAGLELARFPGGYSQGKIVLEACGCSVGEPGEFVELGGVYFGRLLGDGTLDGTARQGEDGPRVRIAQGLVPLQIKRYLDAEK